MTTTPIITTSHFLSPQDALDWYQKNIDPDCSLTDIEEKLAEKAISITQPKGKDRYILTAPQGRWQYELDDFWKNLIVVNSQILDRDHENSYLSMGIDSRWITPLIDGGKVEVKAELLQSVWYDCVKPHGEELLLDYKQYVYVKVTHQDEIIWQFEFYKDEACEEPYICVYSIFTNEEKTKVLQSGFSIEF